MSDYNRATTLSRDRIVRDLGEVFRAWKTTSWDYELGYKGARRVGLSPAERGVTVTWVTEDGKPGAMQLDTLPTINDNFRAIGLSIRDMRMIERRGCLRAMLDSLLMIEGPSGPVERDPYEVLGLRPDTVDPQMINSMGKILRSRYHPDAEDDADKYAEVNRALERLAEHITGVRA